MAEPLKIAHIVPMTPHGCGMYETARDLVVAERAIGLDAYVVDPRDDWQVLEQKLAKITRPVLQIECPTCKGQLEVVDQRATKPSGEDVVPRTEHWTEDRGVYNAPVDQAMQADILLSHSGIPSEWGAILPPIVHIAHGRPRSSFLIEHSGKTPIYSLYKSMPQDARYKAWVTLWPEYQDHLEMLFPKVHTIDSFVDLDYWTPGPSDYKWGGLGGEVNVVIADRWRLDKDPYHVVNGFLYWTRNHPEARLHMYGCDGNGRGWNTLIQCLRERGVAGEVKPMVTNLLEIYRTADMIITPHNIAVRTVREALACGTQVVAAAGNRFVNYTADPENLKAFAGAMEKALIDLQETPQAIKERNRQWAEKHFDPIRAAGQFRDLYNEVLGRVA